MIKVFNYCLLFLFKFTWNRIKQFQSEKKVDDVNQLDYHVTNFINLADFRHPPVTKIVTSRVGENPVYATSYNSRGSGVVVAVQCTRVARQQTSGSCAGNIIEVEQVNANNTWFLLIWEKFWQVFKICFFILLVFAAIRYFYFLTLISFTFRLFFLQN